MTSRNFQTVLALAISFALLPAAAVSVAAQEWPLYGVVTDTRDRPVASASVTAVARGPQDRALTQTVATDAEGRYELKAPGGVIFLTIAAPGHVVHRERVEVGLGAHDVRLVPALQLRGRLVTEDGPAVSRGALRVSQAKPDTNIQSVRTDEDGNFLIDQLTDAPVEIVATVPGFTSPRIELSSPRVETKPLLLTVRRLARVTGRVLDQDGRPVPGAEVIVEFPQPAFTHLATGPATAQTRRADAEGYFVVEVDPSRAASLIVGTPECAAGRLQVAGLQSALTKDIDQPIRLSCSRGAK